MFWCFRPCGRLVAIWKDAKGKRRPAQFAKPRASNTERDRETKSDMTLTNDIQPILERALAGERLTEDDCTRLLESDDIARIGVAADELRRRLHSSGVVTYIIDRNINYTNVCNVVCTFCAFYRRPCKPDTYVTTVEQIYEKID